jgi:diaminopimelate decarboxylase
MGFETASMGELVQALETGAKGDRIVFDSPVKTRRELQLAFEAGVHVNFDNWQVRQTRVESLV